MAVGKLAAMSAKVNLTIEQGATFSKVLTWKTGATQDTATPVDLTDNTAKAAQIADLTEQVAAANTATQTAQAAQTQAEADRDAALAQVQALQAQLTAYQTPTVNGVPQSIHKWQALVGMGKDGIRDSVLTFITTLSQAAQDLWAESTMVERSSPLFTIAEAKLGWTSAQIDDMFTRYNAITLADVTA